MRKHYTTYKKKLSKGWNVLKPVRILVMLSCMLYWTIKTTLWHKPLCVTLPTWTKQTLRIFHRKVLAILKMFGCNTRKITITIG